jgi:DNA end-binding protein Ku
MSTILNGTIDFGLVSIPVAVRSSIDAKEAGVTFKTLHAACSTPVKAPKHCEACNVDVGPGETVRGYEYAKGQYATVSDDEYTALRALRSSRITVRKFVHADELPPQLVDKTYWLAPSAQNAGYGLLWDVLSVRGFAGIASVVLRERERSCAILALPGGLVMQTLTSMDALVVPDYEWQPSKPAEVKLAGQIVEAMFGELTPDDFRLESEDAMRAALEAKVAGRPIPAVKAEKQVETVDLMAALRSTIAAGKSKPKKAKAKAA